jgi:hypothetical protein
LQLNGIDQIVSPRAEISSRELPRPRGYEADVYPHTAHPLSIPKRIPSPTAQVPPQAPLSKSQFIKTFEQLFDSQEQTLILQAQLKEQIRKSSTLLYTLSSSGQMIEGLVRTHFRDMQATYGEKFGSALSDLNRRLAIIEEKTLGKSQATQSPGAISAGKSPVSNKGSNEDEK